MEWWNDGIVVLKYEEFIFIIFFLIDPFFQYSIEAKSLSS